MIKSSAVGNYALDDGQNSAAHDGPVKNARSAACQRPTNPGFEAHKRRIDAEISALRQMLRGEPTETTAAPEPNPKQTEDEHRRARLEIGRPTSQARQPIRMPLSIDNLFILFMLSW